MAKKMDKDKFDRLPKAVRDQLRKQGMAPDDEGAAAAPEEQETEEQEPEEPNPTPARLPNVTKGGGEGAAVTAAKATTGKGKAALPNVTKGGAKGAREAAPAEGNDGAAQDALADLMTAYVKARAAGVAVRIEFS